MRSPEALKPRETHRTPDWPGAELSMETIRAYLADLSGRGRRKGTVQMYSAKLRALYDYLPPDKQISRGTLAAWRAFLLEAGYSPSTVNTHLSAANGLMEYMGRRDLQLVEQSYERMLDTEQLAAGWAEGTGHSIHKDVYI